MPCNIFVRQFARDYKNPKCLIEGSTIGVTSPRSTPYHCLESIPKRMGKPVRRRCVVCYATIKGRLGRTRARQIAKMVGTECRKCEKSYCLPCFNTAHIQAGDTISILS
ncbi:hypothetical protein EVAR_9205_1 [Eumeta japonica]|uniref:PiggyBac transposable element-derived protein 4 n=1 Tax=Eumeta variegata TaxID=151549 RepID=A0A4C1WMQ0_EUMVA|nr:hypothetical protein EVAR_9205_1 [Eumeta japonica]